MTAEVVAVAAVQVIAVDADVAVSEDDNPAVSAEAPTLAFSAVDAAKAPAVGVKCICR